MDFFLILTISLSQLVECERGRVITIHSDMPNYFRALNLPFPDDAENSTLDEICGENDRKRNRRKMMCKYELTDSITFSETSRRGHSSNDIIFGQWYFHEASLSSFEMKSVKFQMMSREVRVLAISCLQIDEIEFLLLPVKVSTFVEYNMIFANRNHDGSKGDVVELFALSQRKPHYLQDRQDQPHPLEQNYNSSHSEDENVNGYREMNIFSKFRSFDDARKFNVCSQSYASYRSGTDRQSLGLLNENFSVGNTSIESGTLDLGDRQFVIPVLKCPIRTKNFSTKQFYVTLDQDHFESLYVLEKMDNEQYKLLALLGRYYGLGCMLT